ncbi:hypothetical protein AV530_015314 [Patagioenas fasciata monilis]|uniref:Uncharacterized protein n=1 Tax=Patagioenas fasciata monilis TaxID=372326 RepID=A0A1V4K1M8_PATFA|nr:hypothetical protein AV530_015314 [Patagioenas fasciata monilis]
MALQLFEIHGELEYNTALEKSICEECVSWETTTLNSTFNRVWVFFAKTTIRSSSICMQGNGSLEQLVIYPLKLPNCE